MPAPGRYRPRPRLRRLLLASVVAVGLIVPTATPSLAADAPDTCSAATTPSTRHTWLSESLASPTDVDWFLFQKPATGFVIATLGKLPGNDRLALYGACNVLIASSDTAGNSFEEIQRWLPAGSYRLRVSHVAGATGGYQLRFFERALDTCAYISYHTWIGPGDTWNFVAELLDTYTVDIFQPRIAIFFYQGDTQVHFPIGIHALSREIVAGGRAPFKLVLDPPPADHDRIWVSNRCNQQLGDSPMPRLRVTAWASSIDGQGRRHITGGVINDTGVTVSTPRAWVTLHDSLGRISNAADALIPTDGDNSELAPGETSTFDVVFDQHHSANRIRIVADAFDTDLD